MHKKTIVNVLLLEKSGIPINIYSISDLKKLLKEKDVIDEIRLMIDDYFSQAKRALSILPANEFTTLLAALTDHIKDREK